MKIVNICLLLVFLISGTAVAIEGDDTFSVAGGKFEILQRGEFEKGGSITCRARFIRNNPHKDWTAVFNMSIKESKGDVKFRFQISLADTENSMLLFSNLQQGSASGLEETFFGSKQLNDEFYISLNNVKDGWLQAVATMDGVNSGFSGIKFNFKDGMKYEYTISASSADGTYMCGQPNGSSGNNAKKETMRP
jgi:hypothetical protein